MIASRDLDMLESVVKVKVGFFLNECKKQGIDVLITSTFRDYESQQALYEQGRTTPGNIVTNAPAGYSFHNFRCAFDFVPLVNGKCAWSDTALFTKCGEIAESVGLEWAGRWKSFKELAHCQYTGGLTLEDLRVGKKVQVQSDDVPVQVAP
jgi:peptidoglycan L-alanyl-D-glutamate endopeptidase CwlK